MQTSGANAAAPSLSLASLKTDDGLRVEVFTSLDAIDRERWDELAGPGAVVRSYDYLRAIAGAGINDCVYFYPVVFDADGRFLAHCCVYTITTDLLQILPAALQPAARALRRLWPRFLQVQITECASPHVIGHSFSLRSGLEPAPLLLALESAIDRIAALAGSPLLVVRDFRNDELPPVAALLARGYHRVSNQPQARVPLRWKNYEHYLASMRSRYRKDLGRRLRRAAAQAQTVSLETSFAHRADTCAEQVRLSYERSQGIKREMLGPAYFRQLDEQLGERSGLLVVMQGERMVGHGVLLFDDTQLVATYSGRAAGPPDDIWFQLLDAAVRVGLERGLKYLNLGLGSYEAKSLMGAEVEALSCLTRSRYALLNWLMRRVPHAMEPEIPHLHHIFHAAEGE